MHTSNEARAGYHFRYGDPILAVLDFLEGVDLFVNRKSCVEGTLAEVEFALRLRILVVDIDCPTEYSLEHPFLETSVQV